MTSTDETTDGPRTGHESSSRADHVAWCRQRAIAELEADPRGRGPANALASLASDLGKHPATRGHAGVELLTLQLANGMRDPAAIRREIEGFR